MTEEKLINARKPSFFKKIKGLALSVLPRSLKVGIVVAVDSSLVVLATWLSASLWFEHTLPFKDLELATIIGILLVVSSFHAFGLYDSVFRFVTKSVLVQLGKALALYTVAFFAIVVVIEIPQTPRSIGLVQPVILDILIVTVRIVASKFLEVEQDLQRAEAIKKIAIFGAGENEIRWAKKQLESSEYRILCFIDEPNLFGESKIFGIPTLSWAAFTESKLSRSVEYIVRLNTDRSHNLWRLVNNFCFENNVGLISNREGADRTTIGNIDPCDLLNRDIAITRNTIDPQLLFRQKILISGAGGSIGSELARQLLSYNPAELILLDFSEHALYKLTANLNQKINTQSFDNVKVRTVLANICDKKSLEQIFKNFRPNIVFHAAAYKHVEIVEKNRTEGIKNNILGTLNLAEVSETFGVSRFILISSDKAVRPTSVMGASKRVSEMILQAMSSSGASSTIFSMVRFGNVLASSGSVLPKFYAQIMSGGPVTVTDENVVRYFMTIPEAVQLVLEASAEAEGGDVFLLDMGEPVRIYNLAEQLIILSGHRVGGRGAEHGEISIEITGLLPGEKMYEELLLDGQFEKTSRSKIFKSKEAFMEWEQIKPILDEFKTACDQYDEVQIDLLTAKLIGDQSHNFSETNVTRDFCIKTLQPSQ